MKITLSIAVTAAFLSLGLSSALAQEKGNQTKAPAPPGLALMSSGFKDGDIIPDKYTQAAGPAAVSPKLEWTNVPNGTAAFALILHDPDVAIQKKTDDVLHWMIFNIPGTARELGEGIPPPARHCRTAPCKPRICAGTWDSWDLAPAPRAPIITTRSSCSHWIRSWTSAPMRRAPTC